MVPLTRLIAALEVRADKLNAMLYHATCECPVSREDDLDDAYVFDLSSHAADCTYREIREEWKV